jgi:hypothetical protein
MIIKSIQVNNDINNNSTVKHTETAKQENKAEDNKNKKATENINANELNIPGIQASSLKELLGKKNALKVRMDQFEKDSVMDDKLQGHADNRDKLLSEANINQDQVSRLNQLKEELKGTYAVDDDSEEQKDLELLEKKELGKEPLTKEDMDRLANMGPLTDYQKAAIDYTKMAAEFQKRADSAREDAINENGAIIAIKLGLLKSSPMLDAKKEAEGILKKVDEEIQKAMVEELKNKVNENLEVDPNKQILTDPQSLINQKKITEEDLKGLAVDEKV